MNGYLDFFEPDFIVEAEPGLAGGLGFDTARVLQYSDILTREGDWNRNGHGLNVLDLYSNLYRNEFQFARRHEHDIVDAAPEEQAYTGFSACLFGAFPKEPDLAYFNRAFADAFDPKKVSLNGGRLAMLYGSGFTSALHLGHSEIEVQYHDHHDPALFVLDAHQPRDLIDFWNLRAVRRHVIPVPVQWLGDLSGFCKEFITRNFRPLPGNPHGVMIRVNVMFARSIPTADIEQLHRENFHVDVDANVRQDWYPSIWRPSPRFTVRAMRPTLSGAQKTFDSPIATEKLEIRFECLHPGFAEEFGNNNRWANVIKLRDWTLRDQVATAFPCDYKKPMAPYFRLGSARPLATTEGLIIFPQFKNVPEHWEMPDGTAAINAWLQASGIKAALSDAGRATQQIIQTLGGFAGVASFAHPEIVKLLNEISRRPISRSAHHHEFRNRIQDATRDDAWKRSSFETLVERNAVELGLELKCTKCSSWTWSPLSQLGYEMKCGMCFRPFPFPISDPSASSKSRWAYRVIGPFALPDYARGGYSASLSIRFFSKILSGHDRAAVTWSAGQELDLALNNKIEADFILWYQRKQSFGNDYPTELVFGEAKSFRMTLPKSKVAETLVAELGINKSEAQRVAEVLRKDVFRVKDAFVPEDIERMKALAIRFPGSVLVFSTMKQADELSKDEIDLISDLAIWGREYVDERRQTRAPVIILTGTELFASFSLHETWKRKGGRHAQLGEAIRGHADNVRVLADMTQQLYLGMPPYVTWLEARRRGVPPT